MDRYNQLILLIVLLGGAYASYTDLRYKKIRNVLSFGLIGFGVINQFVYFWIGEIPISQVLGVILGGGLIAYSFYLLGIWSPGDSKLFWGIACALPPTILAELGVKADTTPLTLGVNLFGIYFLTTIPYLILKTSWEVKKRAFAQTFNRQTIFRTIPQLVVTLPTFLVLNQMIVYVMSQIRFNVSLLTQLLLVILLFNALRSLIIRFQLKKYFVAMLIPICVLMLLVIPGRSFAYMVTLGGLICIYGFLRPLILHLGNSTFTRLVSIFDLKEGMVPAERIIMSRIGDKYSISKVSASFPTITGSDIVLDVAPGELSNSKIEKLKAIAEEGHFQVFNNEIAVQRVISFSPIIFCGAILTILFKSPFYSYLINRFLH